MAICDVTYSELRIKDVVNICDCKKIGRIVDVVIDLKTGIVKGIVVPGSKRLSIFRAPEDIFIPWRNILRIGNDVILIKIAPKISKDCSSDDKCDDDEIPKHLFKESDL
ncbi:MAG: YlmC/YmxH family sporulation protein [Clostridia bacterium]|nr:YlmC/YmxH family sporulation protein [Clostridia bacterium]